MWTEHVALRLRERKIKRVDVLSCIQNGEIIEQYPTDYPFPSCLVSGVSADGRPLHVVVGADGGVMGYVITAYFPTPDKWESDYKTRKERI
jgi:hypothetical protein